MTASRALQEPTPLAPAAITGLRSGLLGHYDRGQRRLPWRGETDPYRVLVSEVMLQQTRVETVERYYEHWLARFPDLEALAVADEDAVLKAWEGLGYYRRARNLHRAARTCRERPDGAVPSTYAELLELPGVGEYTAGAVASIAFGERVPAADGNVRRVLSRLCDVRSPGAAWLRETAAGLVDPERPGDWNQALMDLGATICVPRAPRCADCPVARWCRARASGTQEERPGSTARAAPRRATFALALLRDRGGRLLLQRRPPGGLLGGMWAFPEIEVRPDAAEAADDAARDLAKALGARVHGLPERLRSHQHRFTRLYATYLPRVVPVDGGGVAGEALAWIEPGSPTELAMPVAQSRILSEVAVGAGQSRGGALRAAGRPSGRSPGIPCPSRGLGGEPARSPTTSG